MGADLDELGGGHGRVPKRSFQNEVDVSVVDDKRLSDLPFDLSSRGQWKLDKSF
ncbi:hypothetical protein [Pseudonocardia sp. ICBG1293]|uniref:hypothetical protein n=1 Tax=Pseudonocardia sp. ICBG1293 TaxID=2844382 RepID=UPI001CCBC8CB|nr:hypothetical protein [Pseudonocardia sp. ICBG1293]